MPKLLSVVGARPQFVKLGPLARVVTQHSPAIEHIVVHTGQHYDPALSDVFFAELDLPRPDANLGVGSGSHGRQTGRMLALLEDLLIRARPDIVLTYGDTNSTLAAALVAAKLHIPVAHIEAGVRSFNRRMPEEVNRLVADHVSDLLLAPTPAAVANLDKEGLADRTVLTGDLMYDAVLAHRRRAAADTPLVCRLGLREGDYGLVTIHRAENTDDPDRLVSVLTALNAVVEQYLPLVFPVHPRTRRRIDALGTRWRPHPQLRLADPVGYLDTLALVRGARLVLTDSGGLQKEAFFLDRPVVTLREETEWVETVQWGGNIVAGVQPGAVLAAVAEWSRRLPSGRADFSAAARAAFGDGRAAERILTALLDFLNRRG